MPKKILFASFGNSARRSSHPASRAESFVLGKTTGVSIVGVGVDCQGGHPRGSRAPRGKSRQAHLPGVANRGQRRTDGAAQALPRALDVLSVRWRIVVLSTSHSKTGSSSQSSRPVHPLSSAGSSCCSREHAAVLHVATRGAEMASDAEVETNSRAASVRLRAVERVAA